MPSSTHSIFSGMPGSDSASTLAELDALMVTTRRRLNTFLLTCLCLPSSFGSLTPYMLSQDGTIPCTLLHYVDGELKDVAKGAIVQLKHRKFHGATMAPLGFPSLGCYWVTNTWIRRINVTKRRPKWSSENARTGPCSGRKAKSVWGRTPPQRQHHSGRRRQAMVRPLRKYNHLSWVRVDTK
jgi:hypothetical protein